MNIQFESLGYKVSEGNFWEKRGEKSEAMTSYIGRFTCDKSFFSSSGEKQILRGINGEFRDRELSAIIGPSGSGKSTMLNILSGYISSSVSGVIRVNGNVASQKSIRRKSSYIMQENQLHKYLTVYETMNFAMNLKVGQRLAADTRKCKVSKRFNRLSTTLSQDALNDKFKF